MVVLEDPRALPEGTEVAVTPLPQRQPSAGPVGASLEELAGRAEGLPSDLAQRHDYYRRERKL